MKTIFLTKGYEAIVDEEDYEYLIGYKWQANNASPAGVVYAVRGFWDFKEKNVKSISMHREIIKFINNNKISTNITVDHINGNGLDNRRSNLRFATKQQQSLNRQIRSDNKSGYKGVYWVWTNKTKTKGKWRALIKAEGKRKSLGLYDDPLMASIAYEKAAEEFYGEWRRV